MTPAEHYAEAERLLGAASTSIQKIIDGVTADIPPESVALMHDHVHMLFRRAQVHATLATTLVQAVTFPASP